MLMSTVDESYRLDIAGLSAQDAWKALQPRNQANVLLKMVNDLLRESLADHKLVGQYLTRVRAAMTQLFSDSDAQKLVTEGFIVLSCLAELQSQDKWREWVAHLFMTKKAQILAGQFNIASTGGRDRSLRSSSGSHRKVKKRGSVLRPRHQTEMQLFRMWQTWPLC